VLDPVTVIRAWLPAQRLFEGIEQELDSSVPDGMSTALKTGTMGLDDLSLHRVWLVHPEPERVAIQVRLGHPCGAATDTPVEEELGWPDAQPGVSEPRAETEFQARLEEIVDEDHQRCPDGKGTALGERLIGEELLGAADACFLDAGHAEAEEGFAGQSDGLGQIFDTRLRETGANQLERRFADHSGRLTVWSAIDRPTRRVRSLWADPSDGEGEAVGDADVAAGADEQHWMTLGRPVEVVAGRVPSLREVCLIVTTCDDPGSGLLTGCTLSDALHDLLDRPVGWRAGIDFAQAHSERDRVAMGVVEPGRHGPAL
jgi:hypothetical protein